MIREIFFALPSSFKNKKEVDHQSFIANLVYCQQSFIVYQQKQFLERTIQRFQN